VDFVERADRGGGGDNQNAETCADQVHLAQVTSPPPVYQNSVFYRQKTGRCPSCCLINGIETPKTLVIEPIRVVKHISRH